MAAVKSTYWKTSEFKHTTKVKIKRTNMYTTMHQESEIPPSFDIVPNKSHYQ